MPAESVLIACVLTTYEEGEEPEPDGPSQHQYSSAVNFLFRIPANECRILGYRLIAGSGSGYSYGACAGLYTDERLLGEVNF